MKKQTSETKKTDTNPRLSVRDVTGELRDTFARIGARVEVGGDMAAGVRYAAAFTDGATRQELPAMDWDECDLGTLRTLAVFGCDCFVRAEAVRRIEALLYQKSAEELAG